MHVAGGAMAAPLTRRQTLLARAGDNALTKALTTVATTLLTACGLLVSAYTLAPLGFAMALHAAIKDGNAPLMNALVDWPAVKFTMKRSILQRLNEKALARADNPGWLEQAKYTLTDTISPYMVDYIVAERITPEGFTLFMGPNSPMAIKAREAGMDIDNMPSGNTLHRIRRASFADVTHFEFEMVDKWDQGKVFLAVLELKDFMWRLSSVEMLSLGDGA